MRNAATLKSLFLGICLVAMVNGCDVSEEEKSNFDLTKVAESQLFIKKSAFFDWKNRDVVISFEDSFDNFSDINAASEDGKTIGYILSENHLKQGVTIRLKTVDNQTKTEKVAEIMIESYDLKEGKNQFTIGHINNKPYIIY